jgi:hypothetical protein
MNCGKHSSTHLQKSSSGQKKLSHFFHLAGMNLLFVGTSEKINGDLDKNMK